MKSEYDFSKGVRGKFYKKNARLEIPIYLDPKIQDKLQSIAIKKGKDVSEVVNDLIRRDIELAEELS